MFKAGTFKRSVIHSWQGIAHVFLSEQNFRIELTIAVFVILAAALLKVPPGEGAVLVLTIVLVLLLEILNTLIERFVDALKPQIHPYVKHIKDMAAGMVLIASIGSVIIGLFIFLPHLRETLSVVNFELLW